MYFLFFCTVGVCTFKGAFVGMLSYLINKGFDFLSRLLVRAMKLVMEKYLVLCRPVPIVESLHHSVKICLFELG